jgi:hypothetical protein
MLLLDLPLGMPRSSTEGTRTRLYSRDLATLVTSPLEEGTVKRH